MKIRNQQRQFEVLQNSFGLKWIEGSALLRVSGPDCPKWLQGMSTQDVLQLKEGETAYGLFLNVQGKILFDGWVLKSKPEEFFLLVDQAIKQKAEEHLAAFIIMEDVELDWAQNQSILSIQGGDVSQFPKALIRQFQSFSLNRFDTAQPGIEVIVSAQMKEELSNKFRSEFEANWIDDEVWEQFRVLQNIPKFSVDFGDFTLPQEAGLKQKAVSFTKGCYVGQEPVVMLEHRGKPPKRVVQFSLEGSRDMADELSKNLPIEIETKDQNPAGKITSLSWIPTQNQYLAIGHVRRKFVEQETLFQIKNYPQISAKTASIKE